MLRRKHAASVGFIFKLAPDQEVTFFPGAERPDLTIPAAGSQAGNNTKTQNPKGRALFANADVQAESVGDGEQRQGCRSSSHGALELADLPGIWINVQTHLDCKPSATAEAGRRG